MNTVTQYAYAALKASMICFMIPTQFKVKQQGTVIGMLQFPGLEFSQHATDTAKITKVIPPIPRIGVFNSNVQDIHGAISLSSASKSFSTNLASMSKLASARCTAR
jgi:hypothetical protein